MCRLLQPHQTHLLALVLEDGLVGLDVLVAAEGPDLDGAGGGEREDDVVVPVPWPEDMESGNPEKMTFFTFAETFSTVLVEPKWQFRR